MKISIEAHIEQEIEAVWWAWNDPDCIARWNAASSDWHTTGSRVDLVVGGRFCHHMAAKDGSASRRPPLSSKARSAVRSG